MNGRLRFWLSRKVNKYLVLHPSSKSIDRQYLFSRILPKPTGPRNVSTIYNFDLRVDATRVGIIDDDIYRLGTYEPGTLEALSWFIDETSTVIDVGANIGVMTAYIASTGVYRVIAFEAMPEIFEDLTSNIKLNEFTNVTCEQLALGADNASTTIMPSLNERGSGSIVGGGLYGHEFGEPVEIKMVTLDSYLRKNKQRTISLIKADVEGYEGEVLKGARKTIQRDRPVIMVEFDPGRGEARDILAEILRLERYRMMKLRDRKYKISPLIDVTEDELMLSDKLVNVFLVPHERMHLVKTD